MAGKPYLTVRLEGAWSIAIQAKYATLSTLSFCLNHLPTISARNKRNTVVRGHLELFFLMAMRAGYGTF